MSEENVKVFFRCPKEYKDQFKDSSCILTVSMEHKDYEGARLEAIIRRISKHFRECTIAVCDSLNRYNLDLDKDPDSAELHRQANNLGDTWLKNSEHYFKLFTIPYDIIRWDDWLCSAQYQEKKKIINNLFENNHNYNENIHKTANDFVERKKKQGKIDGQGLKKLLERSLKYLKEECTVMLLWAENKHDFEVYSAKRNLAMVTTHKYLIKPNILTQINLEIRSKKQAF